MNAELKIKYLTWAVIALGLLTISMLSAFFYHINVDNDEEEIQLEFYSMQMSGREFRDHLNLSPIQMNEFMNINHKFRTEARDINLSLDRARTAMFNELRKENPDMQKCKELSAEIGMLHKELKIMTCEFYLNIKAVIDIDQVDKLEELFIPIFRTTRGFGYGRGYGPGSGQGFGRRWGWQE